MKNLEREGDFRCRPPRSWKLQSFYLVVLLLFFNLLNPANGNHCGYNEMLKCNDNGNPSDCRCIKCYDCPPGQGLYPQCGSTTLKGNMTMNCLPCKKRMYSDKNDFGSCHACHVCVGQETLRECNATQNAICKEDCMDGFVLNEIYGTCEKLLPTPRKERKTSPPHKPTTGPSAEVPTLTSTNASSINASDSSEPVTTRTPWPPDPYKNDYWIRIICSIVVAVFTLVLLAIGFVNRNKIIRFFCSCRGLSPTDQDPNETSPMHPDDQEQEQIEIAVVPPDGQRGDIDPNQSISSPSGQQGECSNQDTPRPDQLDPQDVEQIISSSSDLQTGDQALANSSPPRQQGEGVEVATTALHDIPDLCDLLLKDLPLGLKRSISVKICKRGLKGWIEIGSHFQVTNETLEEIETRCSYGSPSELPGEQLFHILESSMPRLTVREFIVALESIEREDVICHIHEKCRK